MKYLDVSRNNIGSLGCKHLAGCLDNIQSLKVSGASITSGGFAVISEKIKTMKTNVSGVAFLS